jgi:hypothetical protein
LLVPRLRVNPVLGKRRVLACERAPWSNIGSRANGRPLGFVGVDVGGSFRVHLWFFAGWLELWRFWSWLDDFRFRWFRDHRERFIDRRLVRDLDLRNRSGFLWGCGLRLNGGLGGQLGRRRMRGLRQRLDLELFANRSNTRWRHGDQRNRGPGVGAEGSRTTRRRQVGIETPR